MKKILLLFLAGFAIAKPAFAQINESDTVKLQLRASLTGNYQDGNVSVLALKSKLDFLARLQKNFFFKSQNSNLYQEFYNIEADNDIFSRNYLYLKPQNKIYPFAIAYISTNFRRKVDSRYFVGGGITYQLIETPKHVIKLSASAVYESTKFNGTSYNFLEYAGQNQINLWRGTLYLGGWSYLFEKHLRFYYDAYWQPAFDDTNNYRTQFDVGLDFPIWNGLAFNALYTFTHENVVITKIKQDDKILTFGLSYFLRKK